MYGDKVTDPDSQRIFKTVWHGFGGLLCLDGPSHPIKRSIRFYKFILLSVNHNEPLRHIVLLLFFFLFRFP